MEWLRVFVGLACAVAGLGLMAAAGVFMLGADGPQLDAANLTWLAVGAAVVSGGAAAVVSGLPMGNAKTE